jgi:hypothetical protein
MQLQHSMGNDQEVKFHEVEIRLFMRSKLWSWDRKLGSVQLGLEFDLMKNCNFDLMKTGKIIWSHDRKIIQSHISISWNSTSWPWPHSITFINNGTFHDWVPFLRCYFNFWVSAAGVKVLFCICKSHLKFCF